MERGCDYERVLEITSFSQETKHELKELFDGNETDGVHISGFEIEA